MTRAEKFWLWVAWHLPRPLVYWAAIRCATHATAGKYSGVEVPGVTITQMLDGWRS